MPPKRTTSSKKSAVSDHAVVPEELEGGGKNDKGKPVLPSRSKTSSSASVKSREGLPGKKMKRGDPVAAEPTNIDDEIRATVVTAFQEAQKSTSSHNGQKKKLMKLRGELAHTALLTHSIVYVALQSISVATLSMDSIHRIHNFVRDYCLECRKADKDDTETALLIQACVQKHNAQDKNVRARVLHLLEGLVSALDSKVRSVERGALLDDIAKVLVLRMHDKVPAVRDRAVRLARDLHTGLITDDITQHMLALLCTDEASVVRCAVIDTLKITDQTATHLLRCLWDKTRTVRRAAWSSFASLKWNKFTTFAGDDTVMYIMRGIQEESTAVAAAVSLTVCASWLSRDCENSIELMLSRVDVTSRPEMDVVVGFLMHHVKKVQPAKCSFPLNRARLTSYNTLLWRKALEAAESNLLEIDDFVSVFHTAMTQVVNPDSTAEGGVGFEDVDNQGPYILDQLLRSVTAYHEAGYLQSATEKSRRQLVADIGFLLRVVPQDAPNLFVEPTLAALRCLQASEDTIETVSAGLRKIYDNLGIVATHRIAFDDVEAYCRAETQRTSEAKKSRSEDMLEIIEVDKAYLRRMALIAHAYLSSERQKSLVPEVLLLTLKLGRDSSLCSTVRALAIRGTALVCLHQKDTVQTFMPVFTSGMSSPHGDVADACYESVFDLMCEYGTELYHTPHAKDAPDVAEQRRSTARAQYNTLLDDLAANVTGRTSCTVGLCKLLSCQKVDQENAHIVAAPILSAYFQAVIRAKDQAVSDLRLVALLETFFASYAHSHTRRQASVATGAIDALRKLIHGYTFSAAEARMFQRIFGAVLYFTDAANLNSVKELDPEAVALNATQLGGIGSDDEEESTILRTPKKGMQMSFGARIAKELSKTSCHEQIVQALLIDVMCVPTLARLVIPHFRGVRLYKRNQMATQQLIAICEKAKETVPATKDRDDEKVHRALNTLLDSLRRIEGDDESTFTGGNSRSVAESGHRSISTMTQGELQECVDAMLRTRRDEMLVDHAGPTQGTATGLSQGSTRTLGRRGRSVPDEILEAEHDATQSPRSDMRDAERAVKRRKQVTPDPPNGSDDGDKAPSPKPKSKGKKAAPKPKRAQTRSTSSEHSDSNDDESSDDGDKA
eukprot:PhM_4_TR307/c1_g1_i1/m.13702/K06678/YCG1, CAPG; condensin complex subunit 3